MKLTSHGDKHCVPIADYDALAERLAEAERLLREILRYPVDGTALGEEVATFLRAADNDVAPESA